MPTLSGSGTLVLPGIEISGVGAILSPDAGPNTRQSSIRFDINFRGNYFDELNGELNDEFNWKADGFQLNDKNGNGSSAGQSNRFWYVKGLEIQPGGHVDLDLYSFLSIDAGKGFSNDQLGLGIIMNEITYVQVKNRKNGGLLTVGNADVAPWETLIQGEIKVKPGHRILAYTRNIDAWSVTQGSSQYLRLAASENLCTVDFWCAGRFTSAS